MFLEYGVSNDGELIYVEQVPRGLTDLKCPYCDGQLLARKGSIKAHHFAHVDETCAAVERNEDAIALPAYDRFTLHLSGKELEALRRFHQGNSSGHDDHMLERVGMVQHNEWARGRQSRWELTKRGKIPVGDLSLLLFNEEHERMLHDQHELLADNVNKNWQLVTWLRRMTGSHIESRKDGYRHDLDVTLTDLKLYRAQWRRILSTTLYFLNIQTTDRQLHKIGVTLRPVEERIAEIRADLRPTFGDVTINAVQTWPNRGNVELYFKHRYAAYRHPIANLTEYFAFEDVASVLRDLRGIKGKEFTLTELSVLAGEPSDIERLITQARRREEEAMRSEQQL